MVIINILKKFRLILSRHQKLRILELGFLMIIAGFMEMLSVSLILPFMEAVIDPDKVMGNKYVIIVCDFFGIQSYRTFLVLLALVMSLLYIVKNIFLLFQMLVQKRFVNNNRFHTQRILLRSYLTSPYEVYLDIKSGDVLQVINNDTQTVFDMLSNLLSLFSELVVSSVLIITILVISPGITLGVATLMLGMISVAQVMISPVLKRIGQASRKAGEGSQQWLIQAVQGIKEIKIMRSELFFERNYNVYGQTAVRSNYLYSTLSLVPRYMIEAVSMASFFFVIAIMIYRGTELESLIPILSSVAMAAIRLLPSVNRITNALANISYSEPSLDKMREHLSEMEAFEKDIMSDEKLSVINAGKIKSFDSCIKMKNVSYKYPKGSENVLNDVNLCIIKGQSVGIIGASGAGKTTAVDVLLGLLVPGKGGVYIDGTDISEDMSGWLSRIGYIPQSIFLLDGTIRDNVAFGKDQNETNDDMVWSALREAALEDFVRSLPDGLETQLGERGIRLSGGQRQRIGIARALYSDPEILFFDEATSALDNETEEAIMESINSLQGSKTMIIIAHRLTTIEKCDVVYRVENGKILMYDGNKESAV